MKKRWFWLLTVGFFTAIVMLGTSNNLYGEDKEYTKEQLKSDCELIGGTYEGGATWGECKLEDGDSFFVDDTTGWFDADCKTQACKDSFNIITGGSRNPAITPPGMQGDFRQIRPTAPATPPAIQPVTPGATTPPTQIQPATPQAPTPGKPTGPEPTKPQPKAIQSPPPPPIVK